MTYELRTYTAVHGKRDALIARFRDHTIALFSSHGMEIVGFWTAADDKDVLVYVLKHTGSAKKNWAGFQSDPDWIAAKGASIANGEIVANITSVLLDATDLPTVRE
jgi:hypothetical protein